MKPRLREIRFQPVMARGQPGFILSDPLGISRETLFIPSYMSFLLNLLDGTRDIATIKTSFELQTGRVINLSDLELLISRLDAVLFLQNDSFMKAHQAALDNYRASAVRQPVLAGSCYPQEAGALRDYIQKCLDKIPAGSSQGVGDAVGLISPHIDYRRGADVYTAVWSGVASSLKQAELVIILGTDHVDGRGRITLTRQDYATPLGVVSTDKDAVEELAGELGDEAFVSELNHRGEHSIESAIVWLQYFVGSGNCSLLPILCGSFYGFMERGENPSSAGQIASTIDIIKRLYKRKRTIVVAAADLAHMGPEFGDPMPLDIGGRAAVARDDAELIRIMSGGDAAAFYSLIQKEGDRRRICGLPPIYIALSSMSAAGGVSAGYAICPASPDNTSIVSICGVLYRGGKQSTGSHGAQKPP